MEKKHLDKDLELLAELLDTKFKGPLGIRFGIDGVIGLIPGVGDILTGLFSSYIVLRCALKKYPKAIIIKMVVNIFIETLIGTVPFFGDLFDIYWKANIRNVNLAKSYESNSRKTHMQSRLSLALFIIVILMLLAAAIVIPLLVLIFIFDILF